MRVQGHADIVAVLLLRLVDSGRIAAVVRINNCLVEFGRIPEAAAIAGEGYSRQMAYLHDVPPCRHYCNVAAVHALLAYT